MLKKMLLLIAIAGCLSCQVRKPGLVPPSGPNFQSLSIKFSFHDGESRQSGRILWRFDDRLAKFIFFTPLNQVGLELNASGENATLVNFAKKAFWQGDFAVLLERLWGIELGLAQMKALVAGGIIPEAEFAAQGIAVQLEKAAGSGAPVRVHLRRGSADLTLRITRNEPRPGRIVLIDFSVRYRAADLETVLGND
jgi:hypothetical protein